MATFTYLAQDAPDYITGHAINLGAIGLSLLVTLGNIAYIRWESEYYIHIFFTTAIIFRGYDR